MADIKYRDALTGKFVEPTRCAECGKDVSTLPHRVLRGRPHCLQHAVCTCK